MSIIGNPLITTNYISDSFSGDASTVAFTLSQAPASAASIAVYISGLYQIPNSAYTISGTTLTFTGAPPTGTNNITVLHLGVKSSTLVPVAGSVTPQMLSNANVVYWSASNNNVGIGNVTPTSLLTVTGTVDVGNTLITGTANVSQGLTANTLTVSTNTVTVGTALSVNAAGGVGVNSTPTTGYKVTIDNGSPTTGDYSPLLIKGGSSSENGGQLGLWNTYGGVSNPKKWIRVDNSGKLGIVNSGYTSQIFSIDDSGNVSTAGTITNSSGALIKNVVNSIRTTAIGNINFPSGTYANLNTTYYKWDIPSAGDYMIWLTVRARAWGLNSFAKVRLYNNNTSSALTNSDTMMIETQNSAVLNVGVTMQWFYTFSGACTIYLQGVCSTSGEIGIQSDVNGWNEFGYLKVA